MDAKQLMVVVGVPPEQADQVLDAIAMAGGGSIGNYTHCAFSVSGLGRFKPNENASPYLGEKSHLNAVEEIRIETFCSRDKAKAIVSAIRQAHPYEEPVIYLIPLLSEDML